MSKCWKCNKEFYSENLIRTLCDECLEKIPKTTATTDFGNLLNNVEVLHKQLPTNTKTKENSMRFFKLVEIDEEEYVERTGDLDFDLYVQTNNKANDVYPDDKNVYIATDENEEEISVDLAYFDKGE